MAMRRTKITVRPKVGLPASDPCDLNIADKVDIGKLVRDETLGTKTDLSCAPHPATKDHSNDDSLKDVKKGPRTFMKNGDLNKGTVPLARDKNQGIMTKRGTSSKCFPVLEKKEYSNRKNLSIHSELEIEASLDQLQETKIEASMNCSSLELNCDIPHSNSTSYNKKLEDDEYDIPTDEKNPSEPPSLDKSHLSETYKTSSSLTKSASHHHESSINKSTSPEHISTFSKNEDDGDRAYFRECLEISLSDARTPPLDCMQSDEDDQEETGNLFPSESSGDKGRTCEGQKKTLSPADRALSPKSPPFEILIRNDEERPLSPSQAKQTSQTVNIPVEGATQSFEIVEVTEEAYSQDGAEAPSMMIIHEIFHLKDDENNLQSEQSNKKNKRKKRILEDKEYHPEKEAKRTRASKKGDTQEKPKPRQNKAPSDAPGKRKPRGKRLTKIDDQPLDRSKMTMGDLVFWNPTENPMTKGSNAREETVIGNVDDGLGLTATGEGEDSSHQSNPPPENNFTGPQLMINDEGELVIDEKSLYIQRTPQPIGNATTDTEKKFYGGYQRKCNRATWTNKETLNFYKLLSVVGTDFSLMSHLMPEKSRPQLIKKYKLECRKNKSLVDKAKAHQVFNLNELLQQDPWDSEEEMDCNQSDISVS